MDIIVFNRNQNDTKGLLLNSTWQDGITPALITFFSSSACGSRSTDSVVPA
jgi:hypothetical protein